MSGGIERNVIGRRIASQRREMIDFAPKLVPQVMNDRPRGSDGLWHLGAAESVERFDFEMLAQGEHRLFRQKRVAVVAKHASDLVEIMLLLIADEEF